MAAGAAEATAGEVEEAVVEVEAATAAAIPTGVPIALGATSRAEGAVAG